MELSEQMQTALGPSYRVERELARGGMSRLLLATELTLDRLVVVKILPPEKVSEVSAARFRREISVSAHLQHPHILPVLAAGGTGDLLYYVMPYVEGESLRELLTHHGRLPVDDAVRILHEVADALAFAHAHGIVHRDVKPENILLQDRHAVLADFGIAQALTVSRPGMRLTESGTMLGTRGYMAPEQAAGVLANDARVDVYALGVLGYEMLTGQLPPVPLPDGAMLRVTERQTPPAVAAALERALSIDAEQRFPTAAEFRAAMDGATAVPPSRRPAARRWATGGALALAVAGGATFYWLGRSPAPGAAELDPNQVVIAPFDVLSGDRDDNLGVWREGMVDVLSRSLDGLGPLRTVSPTIVVRRWSGRAEPEAVAELGRSTQAGLAVFGSLIAAGADSVLLRTTLMDVRQDRVLAELEWRDGRDRVDRLADSVTVGVVRQLSRTRPVAAVRLPDVRWHMTPALRPFLQGEQYYRRGVLDSAYAAYEQAAARDSTFALAHHRMRSVLRWLSHESDDESFAHALRAGALNRGLGTRDSLLVAADSIAAALHVAAWYSPTWWALVRRHAVTVDTAAARYPADPEIRYEQGEVGYHSSGFLGVPRERAFAALQQAIALDSTFAPPYPHAIELSVGLGDVVRARQYTAEQLSLNPGDSVARLVAALIVPTPAPSDSVDAMLRAAPREAVFYAAYFLRRWADSGETSVRLYRWLADGRNAAAPTSHDDVDRGRAFLIAMLAFRGHLADAYSTAGGQFAEIYPQDFAQLALARVVPADSTEVVFRAWAGRDDALRLVLSLPWWAQRGDTVILTRLLRRLTGHPPPHTSDYAAGVRLYGAHVGRAYLALVRGDTAGAMRTLATVPDSLCSWACLPDRLFRARVLASHGRLSDAAVVLDRRPPPLDVTSVTEVFWLLERGRVAAAQGDEATASRAYALASSLWQRGDPGLRTYLAEAISPVRGTLGDGAP